MATDVTTINVGASPNDGTGEAIRDAFIKVNNSFANIDTRLTQGNLPVVFSNTIQANVSFTGGGTLNIAGVSTLNSLVVNTSIQTATFTSTGTGTFNQTLYVLGNLVVTGNLVTRESSDLIIQDSIISLHTSADMAPLGVDDGKDIGIKFHYYKSGDNHAFLGWANDTGYLEYYSAGTEVANVFTGTQYGTIKSGSYKSTDSTASTNTSTGAITTNGGLGVAGAINSASLATTTLSATTASATNFSSGNVQITGGSVTGVTVSASTMNVTNFSSGNAVVTGGSLNNVPIGAGTASSGSFTTISASGNVTFNSDLVLNNTTLYGVGTIHISDPGSNEGITWDGGNGWYIFESPDAYANTSGNLQFDHGGTRVLTLNTNNQVDIPGTADASSSTTGALKIAGGVGIAKSLYTGSSIVAGTSIVPSVGSGANNGIVFPADPGGGSGDTASIKYYVTAGEATVLEIKITNDADDYINLNPSGYVNIPATTGATSKVTGALRVAGGIGVGGDVWATGLYADNLFYSNGSSISSVISGAVTGGISTSISLVGTSGTGSVSTGGTLTFAGSYGVTATASSSTITIGTPQDIRTSASPSFNNLTMTGNLTPTANVTYNIGSSSNWWNNVYGNAIRAVYADLAENYAADSAYEPGTVLVFGGDEEVTECTTYCDGRVAGVVSTNPAYLMNGALENGTPVALRGRVPVKVIGPVNKGDFLVTSETPGHAVAVHPDVNYGLAVFAKAIQIKNDDAPGVIEAVIL